MKAAHKHDQQVSKELLALSRFLHSGTVAGRLQVRGRLRRSFCAQDAPKQRPRNASRSSQSGIGPRLLPGCRHPPERVLRGYCDDRRCKDPILGESLSGCRRLEPSGPVRLATPSRRTCTITSRPTRSMPHMAFAAWIFSAEHATHLAERWLFRDRFRPK